MKKQEVQVEIAENNKIEKPKEDTRFARESAKILVDIVKKNGWSKNLGGNNHHLMYEAWQTVGKYYGYTVKTYDAEPVEIGGIAGFKAYAKVINENTGIEIGGAEAYCMKDEYNWKQKPMFQLASMAQTRAGSKALRQILGFVVALAGYNPTPAEEMEIKVINERMTDLQKSKILKLLDDKNFTKEDLDLSTKYYFKKEFSDLTKDEAEKTIDRLEKSAMQDKIDIDEIDRKINQTKI